MPSVGFLLSLSGPKKYGIHALILAVASLRTPLPMALQRFVSAYFPPLASSSVGISGTPCIYSHSHLRPFAFLASNIVP